MYLFIHSYASKNLSFFVLNKHQPNQQTKNNNVVKDDMFICHEPGTNQKNLSARWELNHGLPDPSWVL